MPSPKDPSTVVKPNPGKLAAGEVHASSLAFPIGNGNGALAAHLLDLSDAHRAQAVSIPDFYTQTGEAFRASVGGPYDGDNVLDALNALKDLLPAKPDRVGFDNLAIPNDGLPGWVPWAGTLVKGGYTNGGVGVVTRYLTQKAPGTYNLTGTAYPADRGVLALYRTTGADFFNAGQTTLVAALWLGSNPVPAGIASANFSQALRSGIQAATATSPSTPGAAGTYTPSGLGLDLISLSDRYPYLSSYPGAVFSNYATNFASYQLCRYSVPSVLATGATGSYLLVHWRESYASTLAAIQPAGLTALTHVAANSYSAVPLETAVYENVKRSNVFLDALPAGPTGLTISSTPTGTVTTTPLSGVSFYNSTGLQFNVLSTANNFFQNSYFTNSVASVSVPVGFESPSAPVEADLGDFGGAVEPHQLYNASPARVVNNSGGGTYTTVAPPATSDVVRFQHTTQGIGGSAVAAPYPYGRVKVNYNTPFAAAAVATGSKFYLYNTLGTTGSTEVVEGFSDERHRYPNSFTFVAYGSPIVPASAYASATSLGTLTNELQVYSGRLVYPTINFSAASYQPSGPDYAAVLAADAANKLRRYQRVFNTGISRNTGTLTIEGLSFSDFQVSGVVDPAELTDHTGGAIVQIKVPGLTGWLDLGRPKGNPDLTTTDFRGCRTGISGTSYTYDTTEFTTANYLGEYLLIVRVTFIKNGMGQTLSCDSITWSP